MKSLFNSIRSFVLFFLISDNKVARNKCITVRTALTTAFVTSLLLLISCLLLILQNPVLPSIAAILLFVLLACLLAC